MPCRYSRREQNSRDDGQCSVLAYLAVTLAVQAARFVKRFYVRRFANNINRRMKGVLYANLVRASRASLEQEGAGELMTKAILRRERLCRRAFAQIPPPRSSTPATQVMIGYAVMLLVHTTGA